MLRIFGYILEAKWTQSYTACAARECTLLKRDFFIGMFVNGSSYLPIHNEQSSKSAYWNAFHVVIINYIFFVRFIRSLFQSILQLNNIDEHR